MRFRLPHQQIEFEIPDEWWAAAGMNNWKPSTDCYTAINSDSSCPIRFVHLSEVAAPERNKGVDWFKEKRMVSVLKGFRSGEPMPPIEVDEPPSRTNFQYRVRDGFHRFYASAAVGFTHLPVSVKPYFDINGQHQ
ncbi:MAG: hypothetical protein AB1515_03555 [Nitrospirota bacterium]